MKIPDQFIQQIAAFPAPLRELIAAELEAGNAIIAIEHGFPAAPCGASIKLARAVKAERRKSAGEVKFYSRNNSSYAGEFTTEPRHFFVLEPPLPPEPDPDMDAIRKALEPKPDALGRLAQRGAGSGVAIALDKSSSSDETENSDRVFNASQPRRCLISTETATWVKRILHFEDKRPPHEVQFALERELMVLFTGAMDHGKLCLLAKGNVNGARYVFELRFEAALLLRNSYSLHIEASWAEHAATHHDYFRKTSDSWFSLWTRDLMAANPPHENDGSPECYRELAETALKAEAHLDSVAAVQRAIVDGMKRGGSFGTSHKEGGTNIRWSNGYFTRSDYGDDPDHRTYSNEADFLEALRKFYNGETSKNIYPNKVSDFEAWKLILRLLRSK